MRSIEYSLDALPLDGLGSVVQLPEIELNDVGQLPPEARHRWITNTVGRLYQSQGQALALARAKLKRADAEGGYALIRGIDPNILPTEALKRWAFGICCFFGTPIHVFSRRGVWHDVPVNLNAHPERYSGVGHNPFHIDVMNAVKPPELVAFHCIRNDPGGGGRNLISNIREAFGDLPLEAQQGLEKEEFVEGVFFQIENADGPLDPYPVVQFPDGRDPLFRFTARGIEKQNSVYKRELLRSLNDALSRRARAVDLRPGDLLILNQRVMAHAREPLGPNQDKISESSRRLLHRLFMNHEPGET